MTREEFHSRNENCKCEFAFQSKDDALKFIKECKVLGYETWHQRQFLWRGWPEGYTRGKAKKDDKRAGRNSNIDYYVTVDGGMSGNLPKEVWATFGNNSQSYKDKFNHGKNLDNS